MLVLPLAAGLGQRHVDRADDAGLVVTRPPARRVLPTVVIATAWFVARVRYAVWAVVALGAVGILNWMWLVVEASTGRRTLVVDFMQTANPIYRGVVCPVAERCDRERARCRWLRRVGRAWWPSWPFGAGARCLPARRTRGARPRSDTDWKRNRDARQHLAYPWSDRGAVAGVRCRGGLRRRRWERCPQR